MASVDWVKIRTEYETSDINLKELADKYNIKYPTVKSRKQRQGWEKRNASPNRKDASRQERDASQKKRISSPQRVAEIVGIDNPDLTEKQRLFCLYYIKSFNATQAAIKAGYSKDTAYSIGWENLRKPEIAAEIRQLKGAIQEEVFIDVMDVLNKYIQIAFSDITDYIEFGQKEVPVIGVDEPETGEYVTEMVSYVDLKSSNQVDGTIVQEVKQGKDGVSIKLPDKMKALEKLEKYFDLLPDKHKRIVEEERLKLERERLELEKTKANGEPDETEDDGFIEALSNKVGEAWDGFTE